jgi:hypothetical protein
LNAHTEINVNQHDMGHSESKQSDSFSKISNYTFMPMEKGWLSLAFIFFKSSFFRQPSKFRVVISNY